MKITATEDRIHLLDGSSSVWSVIREVINTNNQEDAFYVCDIGDIVRKHKIWTAKMPRVKPHYAVKCNDGLIVLETLNALGASFDCASKGEIDKVMSIGVRPERIVFANPAKPASHIRRAAAVGVRTMTFDNVAELHKVQKLFPEARMVIRIRCDAADAQCQLGNKFGCDADADAPHLLRAALALGVDVVGVGFHVGSGCREPAVFRRAIQAARGVFECAAALGVRLSLLDIGGGFPGGAGDSIDKIAEIVNAALEEFFPDPSVSVIAEPGRFYVASAFTLACNVHSMRAFDRPDAATGEPQAHRMYYINDGVYGSFNCILYDHQVVVPQPLEERPGAMYHPSSIWGPTCDGLDQVVEHAMLPDMKVGDWLVFEDMGAYTLPVASTFNGFPVPKVHLAMDESVATLLEDMFHLTESHFEMLSAPRKSDHRVLTANYDHIPSFPITIEVPCRNGNTVNQILDFVDVMAME